MKSFFQLSSPYHLFSLYCMFLCFCCCFSSCFCFCCCICHQHPFSIELSLLQVNVDFIFTLSFLHQNSILPKVRSSFSYMNFFQSILLLLLTFSEYSTFIVKLLIVSPFLFSLLFFNVFNLIFHSFTSSASLTKLDFNWSKY